ncbi:Rossmann-like and DUF2520 domain-containing protein [Acinetobacter larvae]|uniref:F420-dependent NADP oxidoreductase n=1 Tax=Acinetobacter larvae TaxID=1789224 RepID=A0A1B2LYR4_9GAMM|nr:Rossmann-like and DUF2520 domain-containing protein [Acinetobacter larvae]AOA58066.1 F420-dependent NADP oxidoreductase [Acinetobacter larvae]
MRISFVGAGRVASHFVHALQQGQHQLLQIYSRRLAHAEQLAKTCAAEALDHLDHLDPDCDVLMIAVADAAIEQVVAALPVLSEHCVVVHCSGSTPLSVLQRFQRYGVFYPLQSFSLGATVDWSQVPLLLEANHPIALQCLQQLAAELSQRIYCYDTEQRLTLHLAAVFASNFANYCYDAAAQLLAVQQVDRSLLSPLILATAQKATEQSPEWVQTGPAARGDLAILALHRALLEQAERPDLQALYQLMSQAILQRQQALIQR